MRVGGRWMVIRGHEEQGTVKIWRSITMTPRSPSPLNPPSEARPEHSTGRRGHPKGRGDL